MITGRDMPERGGREGTEEVGGSALQVCISECVTESENLRWVGSVVEGEGGRAEGKKESLSEVEVRSASGWEWCTILQQPPPLSNLKGCRLRLGWLSSSCEGPCCSSPHALGPVTQPDRQTAAVSTSAALQYALPRAAMTTEENSSRSMLFLGQP